jgi:hypothetical protein
MGKRNSPYAYPVRDGIAKADKIRALSLQYAKGEYAIILPRKKKRRRKHKAKRPPNYKIYIRSEAWDKFRGSVIKARGRICEDCGTRVGEMNLHHVTYARLGRERPDDVQILCVPCHARRHPDNKAIQERLAVVQ